MKIFRKIKNYIANISIKTKFFIIISTSVILIGTTAYLILTNLVASNRIMTQQLMSENLNYTSFEIKKILDDINKNSDLLIVDQAIQNRLWASYNNDSTYIYGNEYKTLNYTLMTYINSFKYVDNILIYQNGRVFANNYVNYIIKSDDLENIVSSSILNKGAPNWFSIPDYENTLIFARTIRRVNNLSLEDLGVMIFFIDLNSILQDTSGLKNYFSISDFLITKNKEILYNSSDENLIKEHSLTTMDIYDYKIITEDDHTYFVVKSYIPVYDIAFYQFVDYKDKLLEVKKAKENVTIGMLMIILVCIVVSLALSNNIIKHIKYLTDKTKVFRGETRELNIIPYDYTLRNDEIGIMHKNFDFMAKEIQNLIEENYIEKLLTKDAKINALTHQINPHFLYNVLESINWKAKAVKQQEISLTIEALGNLLRASLEDSYSLISLEKELELVNYYVTIQKFRFGERLVVNFKVDDKLLNIKVPKLSIQPLVENSIKYALEEIADVCNIYVIAYIEDDKLNIYVKNDGSAFDENKTCGTKGFNIGLNNINSRIKLTFGEDYGLTTYNENEFAVTKITVPVGEL